MAVDKKLQRPGLNAFVTGADSPDKSLQGHNHATKL